MRALVALCVRHYGSVTALTLLALLLGSWGALHSALDVFPEFVPSQVDIQTEAHGFAPQQVEELVTRPIENAVSGAAGLATLRSESDRKSTRLNSSHVSISYAVFCLKKKTKIN